ncbi:MAG: RodZ domain-containing protein [Anaerolineales bacterium]
MPEARLLAAQVEFLSSAPPTGETETQASQAIASNENPQGEASVLEEAPQVSIENGVQPAAPIEMKAHIAVWRAALSARILRFRESLNQVRVKKEAGKESSTDTQPEMIESNVKEFNPPVRSIDSSQSSQEIFNDLGQQLRQRREMLSLTIEEVERHIHVRATFLSALERGALEELPSAVQTRGIFSNYASFLDLDSDLLMLRFADGLQARHRERHPQKPMRGRPIKVNEKVPPLSSFVAGDLLIGGGMIILLILFTIWGVSRVVVMHSQFYPQVTAPEISNVLVVTFQPTVPQAQGVTLIPVQDTPSTATPAATSSTATLPANVNVELNVVSVERTYVRITVDGKVQFDGEAVPGTAYPYEAKNQVEILVGSASALSITYNGHDLGLMGNFGQVVDNIYTAQGVMTPTATPLPTGTATPRFSPTPTITPSLTPTTGE